MSKIDVKFNKNILTIMDTETKKTEKIDVYSLEHGVDYSSKIIPEKEENNKVFLLEEIDFISEDEEKEEENLETERTKRVILVYSDNGVLKYEKRKKNKAYKRLVKIKYKVIGISLNKRNIKVRVLAFIVNKYEIKIDSQKFYIDKVLGTQSCLKQYKNEISKSQMIKDKNIYTFKFKTKDILQDEATVNSSIRFELTINDRNINYKLAKEDKNIKSSKYYYKPLKSIYVKDFAINIRRTFKGNLILVKRLKEPIEDTFKFKILENKLFSAIMYRIGKAFSKFRRKKINIFYEKFAGKAEEGVFELCKLCNKSQKTKNYFVIDENSPDYERIKNNKNVVRKFSFKYYWLIYNCTSFIASEAPGHLNILRSSNKYFRSATYDKNFVFLQHGIIFMKNLGVNSTFNKGREAESNYMVVSSEKERNVVMEMLGYEKDELIKTGLAMYDHIKYNHINQNSEDYVTIMLTWKPYEEHMYNFEESSYYQNVIQICEMLKKYIDTNKIIMIAHPKAQSLMENTDLKDAIWNKPISQALEKTKLLITDYSSVCYNSFYQGSGVIFYQPDLELYEEENGPLIPKNDEYIGKRAFDIEELESIIKDTIKDKKIDLSNIRTRKHEEIYKTINEFSDGKNSERIYEKLVELKLV